MIANALIFLVSVASGLLTVAFLLRFFLQWARAPYRNPLAEFVHALTDFAVLPARRLLPGLWGLDLASAALAWLTQLLELLVVLYLRDQELGPQTGLAFAALLLVAGARALRIGLYLVMAVVIVQALLSWINPYSPLMPLLNSLARPLLRPFQRWVPAVGGVDLSPLFVVVACQLLVMLPVAYLEGLAGRLF